MYIKKEYAASTTISIEAKIIMPEIEAHEGRDVATIDIPGAYLHRESYEDVITVVKGRLYKLLEIVDPELYQKYVVIDKVTKLLYGLLLSAPLFDLELVTDLKKYNSKMNSYDARVAKNGKCREGNSGKASR